jgi:hypothetical protein
MCLAASFWFTGRDGQFKMTGRCRLPHKGRVARFDIYKAWYTLRTDQRTARWSLRAGDSSDYRQLRCLALGWVTSPSRQAMKRRPGAIMAVAAAGCHGIQKSTHPTCSCIRQLTHAVRTAHSSPAREDILAGLQLCLHNASTASPKAASNSPRSFNNELRKEK